MHGVTSFKHGSLILPTALQTLGHIFVYALPQFQPNLPKIAEKPNLPKIAEKETLFFQSLSHTNIDGDPSIKELW